jgi:hypothetical protein
MSLTEEAVVTTEADVTAEAAIAGDSAVEVKPRSEAREARDANDAASDSDMSESSGELLDYEWLCSTVLCVNDAVDERLLAYFNKYINKQGNFNRIFERSLTACEQDGSDEDELSSDLDQTEDLSHRKCLVASEPYTNTLQKLFAKLDDDVDTAVDKFLDKYNFFSMISSKEDYTMLCFKEDDFYAEHIECSGINQSDGDGASRRICVYIVLDTPSEGGQIEFLYQGCRYTPKAGTILVFPSCPLHPLRVTKVTNGRLVYVTNYYS